MANLEDLTKDWAGAVVSVVMAGQVMPRPAAFVFDVAAGGVAWVEPSYADPSGAATHALHIIAGQVAGNVVTGRGVTVEVLPYEAEDAGSVGGALDWFAAWLKDEGRTWDQERERVRAMLSDVVV